MKSVSSPTNPLIKNIVLLSEKARARKESGTFVIEGQREIGLALKAGYVPVTFVFNPTIVSYNQLLEQFGNILFETEIVEVTNLVYNKIAYREGTEGVMTIFKMQNRTLDQLKWKTENPLILVAEAPEKPGNIGALLRTADAAGVEAFIIANPNTDLYNPNIIRSSVGGLFSNQVASGTTEEIISYLKKRKVTIFCATLDENSESCYKQDFTGPTAIVVGTESIGLSKEWIVAADKNIIIPMNGQLDSVNVSVSAAILLFEAFRQRIKN
ncbi:MAG: RNA methyltransferase [Saprospiraceae bacterium]|nr:RNA methyltransferase [Saprospiraceae bacterium]MBK8671066.1 RNA methyltransferase [Saprospiraceae bacterium]